MNIKDDILSHRYGAREFYRLLHATTIAEAAKEPLKLSDLTTMDNKVTVPSGNKLPFGQALCYVCICDLLSFYRRRTPMVEADKEYIAQQIMLLYTDWSVLDLPTFVSMVVSAKVPTIRLGEMEYILTLADIPSIMGKLEAYDRMRPNPQLLQGSSPAKQVVKPLTDYQLTHLIDGTPYDFKVPYDDYVHGYVTPSGDPQRNAELYWRSRPNFDVDYADQCFDAKANYRQPIVKTVNETLGIK